MKVFKTHPSADIPTFATEGSAGFDIKACLIPDTKIRAYNPHNREMEIPVKSLPDGRLVVTLQPEFRTLVPTGLIFDIPDKHVLKLYIRSSMALKYGLTLANGVAIIDSDYVDPTYIMILNSGDTPIQLYHGDRIAQGILEKTYKYTLEEITEPPKKKTDRDGGLGSTGI